MNSIENMLFILDDYYNISSMTDARSAFAQRSRSAPPRFPQCGRVFDRSFERRYDPAHHHHCQFKRRKYDTV